MNRRCGVLLMFFDLPAVTKSDARKYREFKKAIKAEGFVQLQESVYVKLSRNSGGYSSCRSVLADIAPQESTVMLLPLTMGEFQKLDILTGSGFDLSFFSDDTVYI